MSCFGGRLERSAGRRMVERLADFPGPLDIAGCDLQVAAREIYADAVAVNAIERLLRFDVAAAVLERDDKLYFVMHVLGQRRIGRRAAVRHDGVGGLGE